jgi:hypothetical protein
MDIITQFRPLFDSLFRVQRLLLCSFVGGGVLLQPLQLYGNARVVHHRKSLWLPRMSEKEFFESKRIKVYLWRLFFPFRYRIVVSAPRRHCQSRLTTLSAARAHPTTPVTQQELEHFFSNTLLKSLENHKKDVTHRYGYDDVHVLLVDNIAISAAIDSKRFHNNPDALIGSRGSVIRVSVVQTLCSRTFFGSLMRIIPRRSTIGHIVEEGFNLAMFMYLKASAARQNSQARFILAVVGDRDTTIMQATPESVAFLDSFRFGWKSICDVLHHHLGIDNATCIPLCQTLAAGSLSPSVTKGLWTILNKELSRLVNGMEVFRKETKIPTIFVDGGLFDFLLAAHPVLGAMEVSARKNKGFEISHAHLISRLEADVYMELLRLPSSMVNRTAAKLIRWLIPNTLWAHSS